MYHRKLFLLLIILLPVTSCSTYKYIYDSKSRTLQSELRGTRAGNSFLEGLNFMGAVFVNLVTNSEILDYNPEQKQFKNLKLINASTETLYINMLSDVKWDENNYCDLMDIRIPSGKKCRILVPKNTMYNLYFSDTPEPEDDELFEFSTDKFRKIKLYSGLTKTDKILNE